MTARKTKTRKQWAKQQIELHAARAGEFEAMRIAVLRAMSEVFNETRTTVDCDPIIAALYRCECESLNRMLAMSLCGDDDTQKRVKAMVHERMIAGNNSARAWGGGSNSNWLTADENEFRKMAALAFLKEEKRANQ